MQGQPVEILEEGKRTIPRLADYVWLDGVIVPWDDAKIHVSTACVLGGANVYEGIKGSWNADVNDVLIFRFGDHLKRLSNSLKVMRLAIPYDIKEIESATIELIMENNFRDDISIRIVCYFGEGDPFAFPGERVSTGCFILAVPSKQRGELRTGIRCCISSWNRNTDSTTPPRVKAGANYQNVRYAYIQGIRDGYDDVILLNSMGKVCETPLANIFIFRDGLPITPCITSGILEGITRATLIELFAKELGLNVQERQVDRTELYIADEVFLAGTTREVLPVVAIDGYPVGTGKVGEMTKRIQKILMDVVRGKSSAYAHWLTPVYNKSK